MSHDFFNDRIQDMRAMYGIGFAISNPNAHVKVTGNTGSRKGTADLIAELRENEPDEYACLSEHLPLADMERELRSG